MQHYNCIKAFYLGSNSLTVFNSIRRSPFIYARLYTQYVNTYKISLLKLGIYRIMGQDGRIRFEAANQLERHHYYLDFVIASKLIT